MAQSSTNSLLQLTMHFCCVVLCIPASVHEIFLALIWLLFDEQATGKISALMSIKNSQLNATRHGSLLVSTEFREIGQIFHIK